MTKPNKNMSKKLNIDGVASELRGNSAFFPNYKKDESPTPPVSAQNEAQVTPANRRTDEATARLTGEPTNRPVDRPTGKRVLVRRGFEWYEDQLAALKKLSLKEQLEGKDSSMSAMVREAIDDYLKKRLGDL
jgi:hypothetical protein